MDNYNKTVNAIVASEEAEKLRYLNNYDQTDAPLIIESLSRKKTTDFRFHIILRDIVRTDPQKEDILKDPGIIDILRDYRYADISDVVLNILEEFINSNAVDYILEHETNSWDDSLSEQINSYAQRYPQKQRIIVEGIARCIAYSVDMEVEIMPFRYIVDGRSNPRRRRKKEESDVEDWDII